MRQTQDTAIEALMEQLIENGSEDMASVFAGLFDLAMRIERERYLGAGHYERSALRQSLYLDIRIWLAEPSRYTWCRSAWLHEESVWRPEVV